MFPEKDEILGAICYNENCHQKYKFSKTVFVILERQGMLFPDSPLDQQGFLCLLCNLMASINCELILPSKGFNVVLEQQIRSPQSVFK